MLEAFLENELKGGLPPQQTYDGLESAPLEEWERIPQALIHSLIDSLPQRFALKEENLIAL